MECGHCNRQCSVSGCQACALFRVTAGQGGISGPWNAGGGGGGLEDAIPGPRSSERTANIQIKSWWTATEILGEMEPEELVVVADTTSSSWERQWPLLNLGYFFFSSSDGRCMVVESMHYTPQVMSIRKCDENI